MKSLDNDYNDNRQISIRKAHLSLSLRWAKTKQNVGDIVDLDVISACAKHLLKSSSILWEHT